MCTVKQIKKHFGMTPKEWKTAKNEAFAILKEVASRRALITYGDLAKRITSQYFEAHNYALHHIIGELSYDEYNADRGMISALVVHKYGDMEPGGGFYELAWEIGVKERDKLKLWVNEVKKVHSAWSI